MQTLLILLGPALFAASIYMILARLIRYLGAEDYALVRTTWMTKIFVAGDVLSFLGQSAGMSPLPPPITLLSTLKDEEIIY
jgi:hypothetical protein